MASINKEWQPCMMEKNISGCWPLGVGVRPPPPRPVLWTHPRDSPGEGRGGGGTRSKYLLRSPSSSWVEAVPTGGGCRWSLGSVHRYSSVNSQMYILGHHIWFYVWKFFGQNIKLKNYSTLVECVHLYSHVRERINLRVSKINILCTVRSSDISI